MIEFTHTPRKMPGKGIKGMINDKTGIAAQSALITYCREAQVINFAQKPLIAFVFQTTGNKIQITTTRSAIKSFKLFFVHIPNNKRQKEKVNYFFKISMKNGI